MSELLRFSNVSLGYGRNTVLRDIDFSVERGQYIGLVGPNGVGKSTAESRFGNAVPSCGGNRLF